MKVDSNVWLPLVESRLSRPLTSDPWAFQTDFCLKYRTHDEAGGQGWVTKQRSNPFLTHRENVTTQPRSQWSLSASGRLSWLQKTLPWLRFSIHTDLSLSLSPDRPTATARSLPALSQQQSSGWYHTLLCLGLNITTWTREPRGNRRGGRSGQVYMGTQTNRILWFFLSQQKK